MGRALGHTLKSACTCSPLYTLKFPTDPSILWHRLLPCPFPGHVKINRSYCTARPLPSPPQFSRILPLRADNTAFRFSSINIACLVLEMINPGVDHTQNIRKSGLLCYCVWGWCWNPFCNLDAEEAGQWIGHPETWIPFLRFRQISLTSPLELNVWSVLESRGHSWRLLREKHVSRFFFCSKKIFPDVQYLSYKERKRILVSYFTPLKFYVFTGAQNVGLILYEEIFAVEPNRISLLRLRNCVSSGRNSFTCHFTRQAKNLFRIFSTQLLVQLSKKLSNWSDRHFSFLW